MAEDDLKARSLDSLLALTPAKNMFGEDVSDQWKRKKQTPEQKRAARMAKLDPANWKSAKDVYDERSAAAAKKRKREQQEDTSTPHSTERQPIPDAEDKEADRRAEKKRKTDGRSSEKGQERLKYDKPREPGSTLLDNPNARKRAKKRANRIEKNRLKSEREGDKQLQKQPDSHDKKSSSVEEAIQTPLSSSKDNPAEEAVKNRKSKKLHLDNQKQGSSRAHQQEKQQTEHTIPPLSSQNETQDDGSDNESTTSASTAPSSSEPSDILSPPQDSASSSVSSIPPNIFEVLDKPSEIPPSSVTDSHTQQTPASTSKAAQSDTERQAARERLQQQISRFRSQRKADEKPARSRAELLEQRRQEEQKRKAAKKEQRRKEKEEEAQQQDEEMAKRFSPGGSGSLLASPRSPIVDYNDNGTFTFGRIAFGDGTQFDASNSSAAASRKHKGASDPASALKAAQSKASRLSGLDEQKRKEIEEKDMWLNAKKRAHGERVKDDTSLLKKALKRQEKSKHKSEQDWDKRVEGVRAAQEGKQKKRSENLQKRKDDKVTKKTGGKKKLKRPGFEGSFRGRTSNKKR